MASGVLILLGRLRVPLPLHSFFLYCLLMWLIRIFLGGLHS